MTLSNTATPAYYGEFRAAVMRGEIPVCREISMEMNRIDGLIRDRRYYHDADATEAFIRYCENELTLTDGQPVELLETFKLWAEAALSWFHYVEEYEHVPATPLKKGGFYKTTVLRRLVNEQYLIVARGAAKSLYESFMQSYFLTMDPTTTHQITVAPTMRQAEEIMGPIRTSITRSRGPLFQFMTFGSSAHNTTGSAALRQKLIATKKGVENTLTGSYIEVRPMAIDKLQGLRTKMNTVDEWLSGDTRENVFGAIRQGASKIDEWLMLAVSSEGTVRNGPGDDVKMELMKILRGEIIAPWVSIWHYKLDDVKEVRDETMWPKAQPNIGKTISWEAYYRDVQLAKEVPSQRNDILAKRFGLPMEGFTFFFTYDETIPHRKREFWQLPCALGADLSQGDDFCAFSFLFPLMRKTFGVKTRSYITKRTLDHLPISLREKYQEFINEGSLIIMEGTILDMMLVYDDLFNFVDNEAQYQIRAFGYDPYNAKEFVERYNMEHGHFYTEKVIQGARSESVPLGELKILAAERKLLFDQKLMQWTMGNCVTVEDTNGNRKLYKRRTEEKVDNVASTMDALIAYKAHKEAFE